MRKRRKQSHKQSWEGLLMSQEEAALTAALLIKERASFTVEKSGRFMHLICVGFNGQDRLTRVFEQAVTALQNEMFGMKITDPL